jgi:uncharacterized repeat protein (TIGR02543 family)
MKQKFTQTMNSTQVRQSRGYSKVFNTIWSMALLLVAFTAGCKKDNFIALQGVCPTVVTDPMDKAVDVVLNKVITATFNTPMDATTITKTSFIIMQGATQVSGTVAATANAAVFTFTPDVPLSPFLVYTGTITKVAADKFHTALTADYVWSFTTIPLVSLSALPAIGGTTSGAGTFAKGSVVTVAAVPNTGYTFTNWTENGAVVSTSPNYQFTVAGNRTLVANFAVVVAGKFAVVLTANPVPGGTTTGSGSYNAGSGVTVTALPNAGYAFTNWTEGGVVVSTSPGYTFTLNGNRTLVANFSVISGSQLAVVLSSNPAAGGSTTGSGAYASGTSVTVTATANTGYTFTNWTENGTIVSTSAAYTFPLTANRTLVANFAINTYTLTVTAVNGTVAANPSQATYNYGSSVILTATPNAGYIFTGWSGGATGSTNPLTITITSNTNITANFTAITYTLNVTAVNGTVVKNPNQATYNSGSTVQLTATANSGYIFSSWSGDATGTVNPLTVTMNTNKNITANFTPTGVTVAPPLFTSIFGAFGGSAGITNQGINTAINNGAIGTTGVATLITGFHDGLTGDVYTETPLNVGLVTGGIYASPPAPGTAAKAIIAAQALAAANAFYISISPANKPGGTDPGAGELGGLTLAPGVYKSASGTFGITNGNLTLDAKGDPNAVWIFQAPTSLTVGIAGPAGARSVILTNGALAQNVYWYVGSSATINGTGGGIMVGTIISSAGVTFSTAGNTVQTVLNGRAISLVASVTMVNTTINVQ